MRAALLFCCLTVMCSGCPEAPYSYRMVSLRFPMPPAESTVSLSVASTEVQEAMKVTNDSLVAQGFVRDANPQEAGVRRFVASYSKRDEDGFVRMGDQAMIWVESDRLEVVFDEGRKPGGHTVARVRQAAKRLAADLRSHYGKTRVKVSEGSQ